MITYQSDGISFSAESLKNLSNEQVLEAVNVYLDEEYPKNIRATLTTPKSGQGAILAVTADEEEERTAIHSGSVEYFLSGGILTRMREALNLPQEGESVMLTALYLPISTYLASQNAPDGQTLSAFLLPGDSDIAVFIHEDEKSPTAQRRIVQVSGSELYLTLPLEEADRLENGSRSVPAFGDMAGKDILEIARTDNVETAERDGKSNSKEKEEDTDEFSDPSEKEGNFSSFDDEMDDYPEDEGDIKGDLLNLLGGFDDDEDDEDELYRDDEDRDEEETAPASDIKSNLLDLLGSDDDEDEEGYGDEDMSPSAPESEHPEIEILSEEEVLHLLDNPFFDETSASYKDGVCLIEDVTYYIAIHLSTDNEDERYMQLAVLESEDAVYTFLQECIDDRSSSGKINLDSLPDITPLDLDERFFPVEAQEEARKSAEIISRAQNELLDAGKDHRGLSARLLEKTGEVLWLVAGREKEGGGLTES